MLRLDGDVQTKATTTCSPATQDTAETTITVSIKLLSNICYIRESGSVKIASLLSLQ